MKNIIVYGSRFGQFYLEALKRMKGIKIVGLLAKGSDRSYAQDIIIFLYILH